MSRIRLTPPHLSLLLDGCGLYAAIGHPGGENAEKRCVADIVDLADQDVLDLMRSRRVEQEVLDSLDEPTSR